MVKIKECIIATNGMVISFDEKGEQVPECQGFILDIAEKLKDNCDENTKWSFGLLKANMNWYWKEKNKTEII